MERIDQAALTTLATKALMSFGLKEEDAALTAQILVLGDMFGLHTHGVSRVQSYGERLEIGGINPNPNIKVQRLASALCRVEGDNGIGPLVGQRSLQQAMQIAEESGVAVVLANGSNHFGPVAPYCHIAAQSGFASFICSNASLTIAPWGGKQTRLGNSPMAICVPNPEGDPFLLDMALSVAARAKIRQALKKGESIPEGWATDREGRPTTDPKAALDGFLLAIGGHKGYGLALAIDLLAGLLSNASYLTHVKSWSDEPDQPSGLGHFFLLIDTKRLGTPQWLAQKMKDFAQILHDTPAADPANPVLVPGEIELSRYHQACAQGVAVDPLVLAYLNERVQKCN